MTARILDGSALAAEIRAELKLVVADLAQRGLRPGLGVVLVGDDPGSAVYVRNKSKACDDLGIAHETAYLPANSTTEEVLARIAVFNARSDIDGILVQTPLPTQVDTQSALDLVLPEKDVDGFHPTNVGLLIQKRPRFLPCTPAGIMELLKRSLVPVAGRRAVVVGRSDIVGKPMAMLLLHADATVTVCHSKSADLGALTREADLLIVAIGRPALLRAQHVKPGAVVIDVGMNRITDAVLARELLTPSRFERFPERGFALVGDVHEPSVRDVASALTPVPGGVGPLTIAMLMKNTLLAAGRRADG